MGRLHRFLKVAIVILFLVNLIAGGLILYNRFFPGKRTLTDSDSTPYHGPVDPVKLYKNLKVEPAIHPKILLQMKKYIKSPESSMFILSQQNTKILEIIDTGVEVQHVVDKRYEGVHNFPYALRLENKALPQGYIWHYYTENLLKKIKVYIVENGQTRQAGLKDLKKNDQVVISERWDPSIYPEDFEKYEDQVVDLSIYIYR